jgi:hypothetical protein
MNRPIKFRIWDGEKFYFTTDKINIYPAGFSDTFGLFFDITPNERIVTGPSGYSKRKQITIQQFTGLLDKNGREIYEGDLVECDDGIGGRIYGEVIYENVYGNFCISFNEVLQWTFRKAINLEIIGNIFETHELLK